MTEDMKSLLHAKYMGWTVHYSAFTGADGIPHVELGSVHRKVKLRPYDDTIYGRALFAAIILENLEVVKRFEYSSLLGEWDIKPNQRLLLDEILRMKGHEI